MLTTDCCVSLRSGRGHMGTTRSVCCVVCNCDFASCVSVCQLVLVCPGYDRKLPIPSVGANYLQLLKHHRTTHCLFLAQENDFEITQNFATTLGKPKVNDVQHYGCFKVPLLYYCICAYDKSLKANAVLYGILGFSQHHHQILCHFVVISFNIENLLVLKLAYA